MADITEYDVQIKFKQSGAEKTANDVKKVQSSMDKLKSTIKGLGIGVALKKATDAVGGFINKTSDYIETMNLFRASMGSAADKAEEFVNKADKALGLDPKNLMDSISSFQNLSESLGISSDRAYTMSQNLTQLSADLSSFANISFEQAQKKLLSGFSGQVKPLREYGIALNQASLQETAYSLGIQQRVKDMTMAQKTELIYYQIMTSTQKMQGDLGRSLISPANALRVMKNEFQRLARAIGSIFIPIMMKIIPVVRAVTEILISAANAIAKFFGFEIGDFNADLSSVGNLLEGVSDDIGGIGDSAEDTTKKLNKMLMPFDELNNISTSAAKNSGAGGIGAGGGSLGIDLPQYDMFSGISDEIGKKADEIKKKFEDWLPVIGTIAGLFATIFAVAKIAEFIKKVQSLLDVFNSLGKVGEWLKTALSLAFTIAGAYLIWQGIQHAIESDFDGKSLLEIIGGTGLIAVGAALKFASMVPLQLGLELSLAIASVWLLYHNIKKMINGEITPETVLETVAGAVGLFTAGVFIFKTIKKLRIKTDLEIGGLDTAGETMKKAGKNIETGGKSAKTGFDSFLKGLGFAAGAIAVLGGIGIVINSLSGFMETFSKTGLSVNDTLLLLGGTITIIALAFSGMMLAMSKFKPSWQSIIGAGVILLGLTLVLIPLADIINAIGGNTDHLVGVLIGLGVVMAEVIALMYAVAGVANLVQSPLAMAGVLVVTLAVIGLLLIIREVLPDILDAISTFIEDIGPTVVSIIEAIGRALATVAKAIGETLPPIIEALGNTFDKIFNGIEKVVSTVGDTVSKIVDTIGNSVRNVLEGIKDVIRQIGDTIQQVARTIIWFIDNLGPAIERFTNSLTRSTTRMVNFIISAIEYLINRLVDGVNKLSNMLNSVPGVNIGSTSYIYIPRFSGYAEGGFPETGQIFVANEAGPELVGNIGNRTAVANQNQIVDAVSKGVYDAVTSANAQNSSNSSPYIVVNLGNENLYKGFGQHKREQSNMYGISV